MLAPAAAPATAPVTADVGGRHSPLERDVGAVGSPPRVVRKVRD